MIVKVNIVCDSSAFHNEAGEFDPGSEIRRILRNAAEDQLLDRSEMWPCIRPLMDENGNHVGNLCFGEMP